MPLERNLGQLGSEMPGRLGDVATLIADRASRGESLEQIIATQSAQFPPVYRAVIEAGQRAGRLPAALESLAGTVRRLAETRRAVLVSALYPLFVLILIWSFFAIFTVWIAPALYDSFTKLNVPGQFFFRGLRVLGATAAFWGPAGPLLMLFLAAWFWWRSSQATWIDGRGVGGFLEKLPWVGAMIINSRNAAFTEMFSTLLTHEVPMHEAMVLAADSAGGSHLQKAVRQAAENMQAGRSLAENEGLAALPPLLALDDSGRRRAEPAAARLEPRRGHVPSSGGIPCGNHPRLPAHADDRLRRRRNDAVLHVVPVCALYGDAPQFGEVVKSGEWKVESG